MNAIYSGLRWAQLSSDSSLGGVFWVVDCSAEISVTFKMGGQSDPIHPLDMTREEVAFNEDTFCYGAVHVASPESPVC